MHLDVVDLKSFYASPLGNITRTVVASCLSDRWGDVNNLSVLGFGYALPYLAALGEKAARALAFMPARLGVEAWPLSAPSMISLVEPTDLPLSDGAIDRILLIHALELADDSTALMEEIWRVLAPGGRMLLVVPHRRGAWARFDSTPFGHGQPFSKRQLTSLLRQTLFTPIFWGEALYFPPFERPFFLKTAHVWEKIASSFSLPFSGVYVIEATKQVYRPSMVGKTARLRGLFETILLPGTAAAGRNKNME